MPFEPATTRPAEMKTLNPLQPIAARWPEIEALLDEALALPPPQRPAWLTALSQRQPTLHDTLAQLLHGHAQAETDDFLNTLPPLRDARELPGEDAAAAGRMVGPWRLLSLLGGGGMGTVWLAERADGGARRQVALKLPRVGWDDRLAQRMARERDILAALEHPHIARLYEASADAQGRPYLAMEFVQGQPLDVWCQARGLGVRERLPLLLQVAQAVSHAHARLVVHRDLKPANILVTPEGQVRLLDFGIAKLLEGERTQDTALTQLSGRAMTPDYASPEQIRGEPLSTASDLYSLGVVAFELLAGVRPYRLKRGSAAELEEAIASAEPPLASAAATDPAARRALRGDLDAILNQALKKRPGERYASVADFARDIERHLERQPVQARPDSRAYRLRRFVERNRLPVAAAGVVVVAVAVGTGVAVWQALEARAQAARAEAALSDQQAVSDLYVEALTRVAATATADPAALARPHGVTALVEATMQDQARRFVDQPSGWLALLESVTVQFNYANDFERSLAVGRQYLEQLKARGGRPQQLVRAHAMLGRTLVQLGRLDEAEAIRRAGVEVAPDARDRRTVLERLQLMADLGILLDRRGKRDDAQAVLSSAATLAETEVPATGAHMLILTRLSNHFLTFNDRLALDYDRRANAMIAGNTAEGSEDLSTVIQSLGQSLNRIGPLDEAEQALAQAHAMELGVYGRANRNVAHGLGSWATTVGRRGDHERARSRLAEEIGALTTIDTPAARVSAALLRGRVLVNETMFGDAQAVQRALAEARAAAPAPTIARDSELIAVQQAQALLLAGPPGAALARIAPVAERSVVRGLATPNWFALGQTLAQAQLDAGQAGPARETALGLVALHARHGTKSWTARISVEIAALAAARAGDVGSARREIAALDPAIGSPAAVDRAESALRQAEVWQLAGDAARARAAATAALADLQGQHPDSPRLTLARRLAAGGA